MKHNHKKIIILCYTNNNFQPFYKTYRTTLQKIFKIENQFSKHENDLINIYIYKIFPIFLLEEFLYCINMK